MPTSADATERINIYRTAAIMRWALMEGPVLFVIISFILTGNYAFLALAIALLLFFTSTSPSKNKIIRQLQLNDKEAARLEGKSE